MITALVLAAGLSRRMGQPKMVLPWRDSTVIGHVVSSIISAGLPDIWVVTGSSRQEVQSALHNMSVNFIVNPAYASGEMLGSIQVGLRSVPDLTQAILIVLGDQPQIEFSTIQAVLQAYEAHDQDLVVPSYKMRRGHPWILPRRFWAEVLSLNSPANLREFLQNHENDIYYVNVDTPSILQDLDTPEDYIKSKPNPRS